MCARAHALGRQYLEVAGGYRDRGVTTTSWASGRASAGASTTAAPSARACRRRAAGWCTACRPGPARARPPAWATTARWPRPPRGGPRASPSPVAPSWSCTCGFGTRFSPKTNRKHRSEGVGRVYVRAPMVFRGWDFITLSYFLFKISRVNKKFVSR